MNSPAPVTPNRRQVLKGLGVLGGAAALSTVAVVAWRSTSGEPQPTAEPGRFDDLTAAIAPGGPGKDGIPPIDEPRFVSADQATFLSDTDQIFGLDHHGDIRAYPQQILVWHEIVNDTVADRPLAVTYCPLTATVIGYTSPPGQSWTFGTTGNLVNSNLLMYDRQTDSEWPQILGTAISGEQMGRQLGTVPLVWTTWRAWAARHPGTQVLSTDTGALRSYGSDPYGSYQSRTGYYAKDALYFPVQHTDDRLRRKEVVVGIRVGDARLAIRKDRVRRSGTVETEVGGTPLVARWDPALDTAYVTIAETGKPADFMDAMWFAWYAFYPSTAVLD